MPTWKKKDDEGRTRFLHLCSACNLGLELNLRREGWDFRRDGEPASCAECTRKCRLTAEGLWGADDEVRYQVCKACPDFVGCVFQGRYYC